MFLRNVNELKLDYMLLQPIRDTLKTLKYISITNKKHITFL
jgi:hypothetical protein